MNAEMRSQRVYLRAECAVFRHTRAPLGGLSNMAAGYPVVVNGVPIRTVEALYQALRYPERPDIQHLIIAQGSPMTAKMKSKAHYALTRPDWELVRRPMMEWCLRVKLAQHLERFGEVLLATGSRSIVEESQRDVFWGAVAVDGERLVGANQLGRLLMDLRAWVQDDLGDWPMVVAPPAIAGCCLYGQPVRGVYGWDLGLKSA
jgi:ribA/ribD-fused uncharacterized protein